MNDAQIEELLLQALETEVTGAKVYETALKCVTNKGLRDEWGKYLSETRHHIAVVQRLFGELGLDTKASSPGRKVVHDISAALIAVMEKALGDAANEAAQLVAAECVSQAELKDHLNWELIGEVAKSSQGERGEALSCGLSRGRGRGGRALLPHRGLDPGAVDRGARPASGASSPEERRNVRTEVGAAHARGAR